VLIVAALAATLIVTSCGRGSSSPTAATPSAQSGQAGAPPQGIGGGSGGEFPGVSGTIAAVSGKTLQVQGDNEQTAVTYTGTTDITKTVAAKLADVSVGSCITATAIPANAGGRSATTPTVRPSTRPTTRPTHPTKIAATSVAISKPVNGSCERAGGLGGGLNDQSSNRPRPTFSPRPGGSNNRGGFGGFESAIGTVRSVSGSGFVVASRRFDSSATTTVTVTTSSKTTFTRTTSGTAKDLATGTCVSAIGKASSTGAVRASSIQIRPATDGSCTGFAGVGRGGFGPQAGRQG